jgi:valyl-tRNA synthetase
MLESQTPTVVALVKGCKSARVVTSATDVTDGCGSTVLSSSLTVYVLVKVESCDLLFDAII